MTKPIILLHVIPTLGLGGAERFLVELCRALPAHRYQVIVATVSGEGPQADDLRQAGIEIFPLRVRSHWQLGAILRLAHFMRQQRVDIVHTHLFVGGVFGRLAARLARVPVAISTAQNAYAAGHLLPRLQLLADGLLSRLDDRLVAVSQGARDYLVQVEHVGPAKIEIVPNAIAWPEPVSTVQVEATRRDLGGEGCSPLLGTVARLTPQKGLAYLLQALPLLRTRFPNLFCVIIGDGELRTELEALAARLGLKNHVRFCGPRRDVPAILHCLDLFVLPSLFEGLPMALLEALAAAVPVVATSVAGSREVIEDGVSGRLVPPGDAVALAQAMAELLDDGERAQAMARQGQETVRQHYTIGPVAEAYQRIYEELLRAAGRRPGHVAIRSEASPQN